MLMVSRAQVLSASKPDLSDIITLQASGVPVIRESVKQGRAVSKGGAKGPDAVSTSGDRIKQQL